MTVSAPGMRSEARVCLRDARGVRLCTERVHRSRASLAVAGSVKGGARVWGEWRDRADGVDDLASGGDQRLEQMEDLRLEALRQPSKLSAQGLEERSSLGAQTHMRACRSTPSAEGLLLACARAAPPPPLALPGGARTSGIRPSVSLQKNCTSSVCRLEGSPLRIACSSTTGCFE